MSHVLPLTGNNQLSSELAPPLVAGALPFDLPEERKEKRLMRRREKLPDFLRLLVATAAKLLPMLETSSWDWLRQDSFSRCLLRNSSFDPLCRKLTRGSRQNASACFSGNYVQVEKALNQTPVLWIDSVVSGDCSLIKLICKLNSALIH